MSNLLDNPNQIKNIQALIILLFGLNLYQALVIRRLYKNLKVGRQQFDKLHHSADYLLSILGQNDIELTEFDVIALNSIVEGEQ